MRKMFSRMVLALTVMALICGCASNQNTTGNATTASLEGDNPASLKCVQDGGGLQKSSGDQNTVYCIFADGTVCNEWGYYNSSCKKGECKRTCQNIGTLEEGWYDCKGNLILWDKCNGETPLKTSC